MKTTRTIHTFCRSLHLKGIGAVLTGLLLVACDNVPTESSPNVGTTSRVLDYNGPSCGITGVADVCTFKVEFWNKMSTTQCTNCHDSQSASPQSPFFMESSDVNVAYTQILPTVNPYVDLATPANSTIVNKISAGHNCGDTGACAALATIVTGYITNWANGGTGGSGGETNVIVLTPPTIRNTGESKSFPAASAGFATTVWPLLTANCANCHTESAPTPQSPFFAESDVDAAYAAVVSSQKINLDDPAISRLVVRLDPEFHNCWDPNNTGGADCPASAAAMLLAINNFAGGIPLTAVNPAWATSKALDLTDGILASGGARYDSSTIALYEMKTGSGSTIYDTSGVEPALNLNLSGNEGIDFQWVGGWGIEFMTGRAQGSAQNTKLRDHIVSSGEYSIEAWIVPANVNQGAAGDPSRIISYSAGHTTRNFTLGQAEYRYEYMNRTANSSATAAEVANGTPSFITNDADEDLQASQQHVVATYHPVDGRKIYVNGVDVSTTGNADIDPVAPGGLTNWDDSFAFILGSEAGGDHQWAGKLRLVAIHNRAMTQAQITQNFDAGVGEKFYLMFSVSDLIDTPTTPPSDTDCFQVSAVTTGNPRGDQCFIYMLVSQFDSYSYLFNAPTFISLNPTFAPGATPISGIRIGLNGKEPAVGQAYVNVGKPSPVTINSPAYDPLNGGQVISSIGTIIALEKGSGADEFFLTFEEFGIATPDIRTAFVCSSQPNSDCNATPVDGTPVSDIGLRTFDEINATMSAVTGINPNNAGVKLVFNTIKQQLPTTDNINTFLSAHEIGVAQLAIEYCSALVDNNPSYFTDPSLGDFVFSTNANDVTNTQWQEQVIKPLINNLMTVDMDNLPTKGLASQPDPAAVSAELFTLITNPADVRLSDANIPTSNDGIPDGLAKCGGACPAGRTELVVKATCAALLGSAVSLVQ